MVTAGAILRAPRRAGAAPHACAVAQQTASSDQQHHQRRCAGRCGHRAAQRPAEHHVATDRWPPASSATPATASAQRAACRALAPYSPMPAAQRAKHATARPAGAPCGWPPAPANGRKSPSAARPSSRCSAKPWPKSMSGHQLPWQVRKVAAGQHRVVGADPAAQRDLQPPAGPATASSSRAERQAGQRSARARRGSCCATSSASRPMPPSRCAVTIGRVELQVTVSAPNAPCTQHPDQRARWPTTATAAAVAPRAPSSPAPSPGSTRRLPIAR